MKTRKGQSVKIFYNKVVEVLVFRYSNETKGWLDKYSSINVSEFRGVVETG